MSIRIKNLNSKFRQYRGTNEITKIDTSKSINIHVESLRAEKVSKRILIGNAGQKSKNVDLTRANLIQNNPSLIPLKDLIQSKSDYQTMKRGFLVSSLVQVSSDPHQPVINDSKGFEGGKVLRSTMTKFKKNNEGSQDFTQTKSIFSTLRKNNDNGKGEENSYKTLSFS